MRVVKLVLVGAVLAMSGCTSTGQDATVPPQERARGSSAHVEAGLHNLALSFIENRGQVDGPVKYYVHGVDTSLYFTPTGVTFALTNGAAKVPMEDSPVSSLNAVTTERWAVKLDFVGADTVEPKGVDLAQGVVSHFASRAGTARTAIPTYSSIAYEDLWPGIDMVYAGTGSELKYSFVVHPGADPAQIRLAYRGASKVSLNDKGQLEVTTPAGGFIDDTPYSYQDVAGARIEVPSSYQLEHGSEGAATVTIPVGGYDPTQELVIDPVVLVQSGFIGGALNDRAHDLAIDTAGDLYISGAADSVGTFPVTVGPDLTYDGPTGGHPVFVAKLAGDGSGLIYAGYIEGTFSLGGTAIAVDGTGSAYVTGTTSSQAEVAAQFPATVGPDLTPNGIVDVFVAKVAADGTALVYAGFVGAGLHGSIAVDPSGHAYVTGYTDATEATFPVIGGPDLTHNGLTDVFVAKVAADGTELEYAGYLGGAETERSSGIAVDAVGNAYLVGFTQSNHASFPVLVGPDLTFNVKKSRGPTFGRDAFVAKVSTTGTLVYAGYIGGQETDEGTGVTVDAAGNAYVVGNTISRDFPVTRGSFDRNYAGGFGFDGFLAKVAADGTRLIYAGFIGSDTVDSANAVTIDGDGAAYVTGLVGITTKFPTPGGFDTTHNGATDAFVVKINPAGTNFEWGTYLGGTDGDVGNGIAVNVDRDVIVAGGTGSTEATFPVAGSGDHTQNGGSDVFIAIVSQSP